MMAALIILLIIISIWHFIYDSIILPAIRQHNRNRLFALRDELRWEMVNGIDHSDYPAFNLVHDAINTFVNRLPLLTITVQRAFEKDLENNENLRHVIEKRIAMLNQCDNDTIKRIAHDANGILESTYIANAGGWFIYIVPIAIAISTLQKLAGVSAKLLAAPPQEVHRIIPHTANEYCY